MSGPLPDWLVDQISMKTGAPPGTGRLVRRRCVTCRHLVLVGLDGPVAAVMVAVDPEPITTAEDEEWARAAGRRSYALRRRGTSLRLQRRDQWMRARTPAGSQDVDGASGYLVVAEHACREEVR